MYTKGAETILDVSTGVGKNAYLIRVFNKPKFMLGIDIFLPYLKLVKYHRIYGDVILCDAASLPIKNETFDVVIASEIIEHLHKQRGLVLLEEVDRVARRRVIIITPKKGCYRSGVLTPLGFNPHEAHLSSWDVNDFKSRGYKVYGLGLYISRFLGKYSHYINLLFSYFTIMLPCIANELIAVKEKGLTKSNI